MAKCMINDMGRIGAVTVGRIPSDCDVVDSSGPSKDAYNHRRGGPRLRAMRSVGPA